MPEPWHTILLIVSPASVLWWALGYWQGRRSDRDRQIARRRERHLRHHLRQQRRAEKARRWLEAHPETEGADRA